MNASHLDPLRLNFRRLGIVLTVVSACLTGLFGVTMSTNPLLAILLCVGLMGATIGSAYIWPFVAASLRDRAYISAGFMIVFGGLFTVTDLTSNFGSIAWQRGTNIDEAKVSEAKYDDSRAKVTENRENLALWKSHLAKLEAENAWLPTVTADALRANLAAADEAVTQERKRGGCGPKCLKLMETKAELEKNIALAEQKADLTSRIAATQKLVDEYRDQSAAVEKIESAAMLQNVSLASMFTLTLDPTEEAQHWTDKGVAWLVALFLTFGAMGANFIGWGVPQSVKDAGSRAMTETRAAIEGVTSKIKAADQSHTTIVQVKDDVAARLASILRDAGHQLKGAT